MYTTMNNVEGMAPRLYRSPAEILRDMERIKSRIEEISDMLSIHNLIIEMIPEWSSISPENWIPKLEETLDEANDALETLKELKERLAELKSELEEVECIIRR
jgi:chromosome segregation ATPase